MLLKIILYINQPYIHTPNIGSRRVFTAQQETCLVEYLITAAIGYGLGQAVFKKLAYQYKIGLNIIYLEKWVTDLIGLKALKGITKVL